MMITPREIAALRLRAAGSLRDLAHMPAHMPVDMRSIWLTVRRSARLTVMWAAFSAALSGCAAPRHEIAVARPTTVRPEPRPATGIPTGAIYQQAGFRPMFEDRKPRYVGDMVTVQLNEKLDASQKANNTAERNDSAKIATPGISGVLGGALGALRVPALAATASSANKFDGKGENAASNTFTGTITLTVIEVLANGNLVVAGEKQMGVRQNSEILKVSAVVDPAQIQPVNNTISSTQLADVRIDFKGGGNVEEALIQGWFSRIFNSWSPF